MLTFCWPISASIVRILASLWSIPASTFRILALIALILFFALFIIFLIDVLGGFMGGSVVLGFSLSFNDLMHSDGIQKDATTENRWLFEQKG
jgi:hypothetical protein